MVRRAALALRPRPASAPRRHGAAQRELGPQHQEQSHSVSAQLVVPEKGAAGVIIEQGGAFGGWALYAKDGKPAYCYNFAGIKSFTVYGDKTSPAGDHQVQMEFTYDGGSLAKSGDVKLYLDGKKCGKGASR